MFRKAGYLIVFLIAAQLTVLANTKALDQLFDEYGKVSWTVEKIHLNQFEDFLIRNPEMNGYIIFDWRTKREFDEMRRRVNRAKNYLIKRKKVDPSRIIIIEGKKQYQARTILQPVKRGLPPPDLN